jgi:uncharacterized protein (TIGR04222 family)
MGQPWGLSGPQFLVVYAVGFGVVVLITAVVWQFMRGLPSRRPVRQLDHYEIAFLAGGKQRVAEVVIAELIDRGALRVDGRGRLYLADPSALSGPFVTSLGIIPPDGVTTHTARNRVSGAPGIKQIAVRLRADGLIIPAGRLMAMRWLVAVLMLALLATGIARMIEGHANHRPINDLGAEFVGSILLGLWLFSFTFKNSNLTRYGHWHLRKLSKSPLVAGVPLGAGVAAAQPSSTASGCGGGGCGGGGCGGGGCGG